MTANDEWERIWKEVAVAYFNLVIPEAVWKTGVEVK
jgi:hypothetical protein